MSTVLSPASGNHREVMTPMTITHAITAATARRGPQTGRVQLCGMRLSKLGSSAMPRPGARREGAGQEQPRRHRVRRPVCLTPSKEEQRVAERLARVWDESVAADGVT